MSITMSAQVETGEPSRKPNCLRQCSNAVVHTIERCFFSLGLGIGKYPWVVILLSFVVLLICVPGLPLFFYEENRASELWVASDSQAFKDNKWVEDHFPSRIRFSSMLLVDSNVLTPAGLQAMADIDEAVKNISGDGYTWDSVCARLGSECWSNSILELWSFNLTAIRALSQQDILDAVNSDISISPVYGTEFNLTSYIGRLTYDSDGNITGAAASLMNYVINFNVSVVDGEEVDLLADAWEQDFLDLAELGHSGIDNVYYYAFRSFGDVGGGAILGDLQFLIVGYMLVIAFVCAVLGRFNAIEQRIYVTLCGVACIGLAIGISFGLCSYFGLFYGPLHSILPFLLLGIGVDDMFVIVQAYDNLDDEKKKLPVHERIAFAISHAGASITVTSITDILAFGMGGTTILPALRSFCLYSCVGILATFLLQATFFVACLALSERRAEARRNACCCCYVHPATWEPNKCSQKNTVQNFFGNVFAKYLLKLPGKIIVAVVTLILFAVNLYGMIMIEQEFDPSWFLPAGSYPREFLDMKEYYFPSDDVDTNVYIGTVNYYGDFSALEDLYADIVSDPYVLESSVDCWYISFRDWWNSTSDVAVTSQLNANGFPQNESAFYSLLQMFLYSPPNPGSRFIRNLVFDDTNSFLRASRISLSHTNIEDSSSEIQAMDSLRAVTAASIFPESECFPYTLDYLDFETNKVIQDELYRNLGLAFACVFLMTLLLIANIWTSILVAICVALTLVDVVGIIYFWGMTIDTVTSINFIVAIGLAVDYSAHIGHSFMTHRGTRNERADKTLLYMAPAVFYGGFSTFLAFILLAGSKSYVFSTFFKVFFCVVLFGLFHGLVVLPVILSWVGPAPYDELPKDEAETNKVAMQEINGKAQNGQQSNIANGGGYTNPALDTSIQEVPPSSKKGDTSSQFSELTPVDKSPTSQESL